MRENMHAFHEAVIEADAQKICNDRWNGFILGNVHACLCLYQEVPCGLHG